MGTNAVHTDSPRPRITVISGYFNRADTAFDSVASILSQDFVDFEFLVFDDRSTDGTLNVLRSFDDPRLRVIEHAENIGFVRGMIRAVRTARGELIAVHGSGDISHPSRLRKQVAIFDRHPDVGVVGSCRATTDVQGRVLDTNCPPEAVSYPRLRKGNVFSHGEVMFRRSAYEEVGGYRQEFTYSQDYDLWLRMARAYSLRSVPEVLYYRRVQEDGVSFRPDTLIRQAKFSLLAQRLADVDRSEQAPELRRVAVDGIDHAIPTTHAAVQAHIAKKALALGIVGRWHHVRTLADRMHGSTLRQRAYRGLVRTYLAVFSRLDPDGRLLSMLAPRVLRIRRPGR